MIGFKLFSKSSSDESDEDKKLRSKWKNEAKALTAVSLGTQIGRLILGKKLDNSDKSLMDKDLYKNVSKEADRMGVNIHVDKNFKYEDQIQLRRKDIKARKDLAKKLRKLRKKSPEKAQEFVDLVKKVTGKSLHNLNKERVLLENENASTLAHELGHANHHYQYSGRKGGVIGKIAHSTAAHAIGEGARAGVIMESFRKGMKDEADRQRGKEVNTTPGRMTRAGLALAATAPVLVREATASKHGMRILKKAGANKEQLKAAGRDLRNAYGTYALGALKRGPISAEGSYQLGRGIAKWTELSKVIDKAEKEEKESKKD